jgi:cathepsin A (carboxypeptidase C)
MRTDEGGSASVSSSSCLPTNTAIQTKRCLKRIQIDCYDTHDPMNCRATHKFCSTELSMPLYLTGLNPYDLSKKCGDNPLCYIEMEYAIYLIPGSAELITIQ